MRSVSYLLGVVSCLGLVGCKMAPKAGSPQTRVQGESFVLAREEAGFFAFRVAEDRFEVRSTYLPNLTNTVRYELGKDYNFDPALNSIRRTAQSRIPDFSTNVLYGQVDFDHSKFPGFGNNPFFCYVDYRAVGVSNQPVHVAQTNLLSQTLRKLRAGEALTIVAFGDSITAGGDATQPDLIFWKRWANGLQAKYPAARVTAINGATGGDSTVNGLARLEEKVLKQKPDVVLIGFGMNDHNVAGYGVPVDKFGENLKAMVDRIRSQTSAEIILYSTFPPNPKWRFGSHSMEKYEQAIREVAREKNCAYGDVFHEWLAKSQNKKPEDLLANNINHPNDYGHGIYFEVLEKLGL